MNKSYYILYIFILLIYKINAFINYHNELNKCQMTFMYSTPMFKEIFIPEVLPSPYKLYYYTERQYSSSGMKFRGRPIIFLPGNCGSYKQVRSIASVTMDKAHNQKLNISYDFFTLDFNEEKSAFSGFLLKRQTEYSIKVFHHLLKQYKTNGAQHKFVLIGHSLGGLIAKGVLRDESIDPQTVLLILTLATPHKAPIIPWDPDTNHYYHSVRNFWSRNDSKPALVSISGGCRDLLVPSDYAQLPRSEVIKAHSASAHFASSGLATVWSSNDHLSIVWCNELTRLLSRLLMTSPFPSAPADLDEYLGAGAPKAFSPGSLIFAPSDYSENERDKSDTIVVGEIRSAEGLSVPGIPAKIHLPAVGKVNLAFPFSLSNNARGPLCLCAGGIKSFANSFFIPEGMTGAVGVEIKRIPPTSSRKHLIVIRLPPYGSTNDTPDGWNGSLRLNLRLRYRKSPPTHLLVDYCHRDDDFNATRHYYWIQREEIIWGRSIVTTDLVWLAEIWQGYTMELSPIGECGINDVVTVKLSVPWSSEDRFWTMADASKLTTAPQKFWTITSTIFLQSLPFISRKNGRLPTLTLFLDPDCRYALTYKLSFPLIVRQVLLYQNYYLFRATILFFLVQLLLSSCHVIGFRATHESEPARGTLRFYAVSCAIHFTLYLVPYAIFSIATNAIPTNSTLHSSFTVPDIDQDLYADRVDNLIPRSLINHVIICALSQVLGTIIQLAIGVPLLFVSKNGNFASFQTAKVSDEEARRLPKLGSKTISTIIFKTLMATFIVTTYTWSPYLSWIVFLTLGPKLTSPTLWHSFPNIVLSKNVYPLLMVSSTVCLIAFLIPLHLHTLFRITDVLSQTGHSPAPSQLLFISKNVLISLFPPFNSNYPATFAALKLLSLGMLLPLVLVPEWSLKSSLICPLARTFKNSTFAYYVLPILNSFVLYCLPRCQAIYLTIVIELNLVMLSCHVIFTMFERDLPTNDPKSKYE